MTDHLEKIDTVPVQIKVDGAEHLRVVGDAGRSVTMRVIDSPGTGYVWTLARVTGQMILTDIEDVTPMQEATDPMELMFGGERLRDFIFLPRLAESAVAQFELLRPWLPNEVAKRVVVTVTTGAA